MIILFSSVFFLFHIFFVVAYLKKDLSVIDIAWGLSFCVVYLAGAYQHQEFDLREKILGVLVLVWSLRLSLYIFFRALKLKKEDFRYTEMKTAWKGSLWFNAYLRVYMLQAVLAVMIAYPLFMLHRSNSSKDFGTVLDILGISLFLIGFLIEAIADYQKNVFKNNPDNKDKPCEQGLWKYSRHPNYFGESLVWWGAFLIIANVVPYYQIIWGPLLIQFLLLKVSGVAMLEESYDKKPAYAEYRKKTNAFIPWFPRRTA